MQSGITHPELLPERFTRWFTSKGWQVHPHQLAMLLAARNGQSALLIAPTGGGKTLAGFLPSLVELEANKTPGLHTLYISPLKALATDIERNLAKPIVEMGLNIRIEVRSGDTPSSRRKRQMSKPPHILLTTPESLELLLSYPEASELFKDLKRIIIDEVHALAPGKRGHLAALCIARVKRFCPELQVSGLSATVAEPEQFAAWLGDNTTIVQVENDVPPHVQLLKTPRVPWSGYMANFAVPGIYQMIAKARTTIVFVNTRAQAEFLFQKLWEANKEDLPIALHHGSLEREHRLKVEAMMGEGSLRAIVATASLDLGLDWAAVDQVIQVGAPKGISRLLQRIGRSNHRMDTPSDALLVPCNRFEMIECIAVTDAIAEGVVDGEPMHGGTLDVLAQFVMNCACAGGFREPELLADIQRSAAYRYVTADMLGRIIAFVAHGGYALRAYDQFQRIHLNEQGLWVATATAIKRHRMNTGTIVEYETLRVTMRRGRGSRDLGRIEEYFIQGLLPGDTFIFAGLMLRYKGTHDSTVQVEPASGDRPKIPSFKGGKLPLSPSLAKRVCRMMEHPELWNHLPPMIGEWLGLQQERSALPSESHLLVESFPHEKLEYTVFYSFAGRNANQTLGLLLTHRMEAADLFPLGFVANDYALALWGLKPLQDPATLLAEALSKNESDEWIETSQMARRAFREVAVIAGLVERRHPGKRKTGRQVTMSTDLIYDVLRKYEPDHLLLQATRHDVLTKLADIDRLRESVIALPVKHMVLERISPLAVPLILEIGIEKIKGKGETELLSSAMREQQGDALLEEAVQ